MTLADAVHSEAGTFHWLAAACTSIIDAAAAAGGEVAPGALARDALARGRILDLDLAPVAVELLGDELRKAGDRALAHFRTHRADKGGVVRADRHPDGDLGRAVGRAHHGRTERGKAQAEREAAAERGAADEEGTAGEFRNGCHDRLLTRPWRRRGS